MSTEGHSTQDKASPNWEAIERDYRVGVRAVTAIAQEHGITEGAIRKRAKRDGWVREPQDSLKPVELATADALDRAGFVYVIYLQDTSRERFYKIGMAASFTARFDAHQCASPFPICVACAYYVPNMRAEERLLHSLFKIKRVRGEWFRLSDEDLKSIAGRAKLL